MHPAGARAGDLEVSIAVADGKRIASGVLIAEDRSLPITGAGKMKISGLPDKRIAVTVDAVVGEQGGVRYLGVTEVKTLPGKSLSLTVTIKPVADIEAFCSGCHPARGETLKPGQVFRDVHVSGKEMPARYLGQVDKYNAEAELQRTSKAKNPQLPILLEKRVVKVDGKNVVRLFCTCESCHTTHLITPWKRRVRAGYLGSSVLCEGCHS